MLILQAVLLFVQDPSRLQRIVDALHQSGELTDAQRADLYAAIDKVMAGDHWKPDAPEVTP